MDKDYVIQRLEQIEEKYSNLPDEQKMYGSKFNEEENPNFNFNTHPGTYKEIQNILQDIKADSTLINDFDIGMKVVKLAPYNFSYLGEEIRENVEIFMEACKGDINGAFSYAGKNILENEQYMIMAVKINSKLYNYMNENMKKNPNILIEHVREHGFIPEEASESLTQELFEQLKPYITYQIEGIREEKYMGEVCDGYEYEFEYYTTELTKNVICCSKNDEKFEIELYTEYGECPSGVTTASWGRIDIHKVEKFGEITHLPIKSQTFELKFEEDGFTCPAFEVSYTGNDIYYPNGRFEVNMELFVEKEKSEHNISEIKETISKEKLEEEMNDALNRLHTEFDVSAISTLNDEILTYEINDILSEFENDQNKAIEMAHKFVEKINNHIENVKPHIKEKEIYYDEDKKDWVAYNYDYEYDLDRDDIMTILKHPEFVSKMDDISIKEYIHYVCSDDDKDVILAAIQYGLDVKLNETLEYYEISISDRLRNDKEIVSKLLDKETYENFVYIGDELKNDKKFVLECINSLSDIAYMKNILKYISDELKSDKEFILQAINLGAPGTEYASEELKNDKEIMMAAVKLYGGYLEDASEELKNDAELAINALKSNMDAIQYVGYDLWANREFVLEAVKLDKRCLENASEELALDKEVVIAAINNDGTALEWADEELKKDKEIVLLAVKQNKDALKYVDESLKEDKEFMAMVEDVIKEEKLEHNISEVEETISDVKEGNIYTILNEFKEAMKDENEQEVNQDGQDIDD